MLQTVVLPSGIVNELCQEIKCGMSRCDILLEVAPQAFERGGADVLVELVEHSFREEVEVLGSAHLAPHGSLDLSTQRYDELCCILHDAVSFIVTKIQHLAELPSPMSLNLC